MSERQRLTGRGDPAGPHSPTPTDDRLPDGQYADHWVLGGEERKKGFVRPVRTGYVHETCGGETRMPRALAETYARDPSFYGYTFCSVCREYRPVGEDGEFVWGDGSRVGT